MGRREDNVKMYLGEIGFECVVGFIWLSTGTGLGLL
jgi:hypothetical protein